MSTTVSGNIKNLGTGAVGVGNFVRFWLRGYGQNTPRVTGAAIVAPVLSGTFYFDIQSDASGNLSGTLYSTRDAAGTGNGDIEAGGSYLAVWYGMQVYNGSYKGPEVPIHAKNGATLDPSSVTPITTPPVVSAPTGDGTYLRIDGGNGPVTGALTLNAALTLNSSAKPNTDDTNALGDSTHRWAASLGTTTTKQLNGVPVASQYSGADIGAQVNAAYAALSANGGRVRIPAGSYSFSTTILAGTQSKPLLLEGDPGGTTLTYTGSGSAITFDCGKASGVSPHYRGLGLENIVLHGPGSGTAAVGITLGGTNGAEGFNACGVTIDGFGTNVLYANNTWGTCFEESVLKNGGVLLSVPNTISNAGEALNFKHVMFANDAPAANFAGAVAVGSSIADTTFDNCSFDCAQLVTSNGVVNVQHCHFENPGGVNITTRYIDNTGSDLLLAGCDFLQDQSSGSMPSEFVRTTGPAVTVAIGNNFFTAGGTTIAAAFKATGTSPVVTVFGTRSLSSSGGTITNEVDSSGATTPIVTKFPTVGGTVVLDTATQTLSNKTLSTPVLSGNFIASNILFSTTAPTISSGFGTSPSIASNNGTACFTINVGSGGTASSGVIGLPTASNGWVCWVHNLTAAAANRSDETVQTASVTTGVTIQNQAKSTGAATAWQANDILHVTCFAR